MGCQPHVMLFHRGMLTVEKIDEQTSRQGNLHYLYKVCEQRLSKKTNILVNSYPCLPVYC